MSRSTQSGTKAMTAAWQVLYTQSCTQPYLFGGAVIDLTNMVAGDTINIRIRKVVLSGGAWIAHDQMSYSDAQKATQLTCQIAGILDVYGVEISAQQTAMGAALISLDCEFFDAKRLGFA
jgi:hypothetical protein